MKKILICAIYLITLVSFSQVTNQGVPNSWSLGLDNSQIIAKELPTFDLEAVKAEDAVNDYKFDLMRVPPPFVYPKRIELR